MSLQANISEYLFLFHLCIVCLFAHLAHRAGMHTREAARPLTYGNAFVYTRRLILSQTRLNDSKPPEATKRKNNVALLYSPENAGFPPQKTDWNAQSCVGPERI